MLPEVVFLSKTEDSLSRNALLLIPELKCLIIILIYGRIQTVWGPVSEAADRAVRPTATETAPRSAAAVSEAAAPATPAPVSGADHRLSIEAAPPTGILPPEGAAAPTGEAVRHRTEEPTPRPPRNRTEVRAAVSWAEAEESAAETAADATLTAVKRLSRQISTYGAQDAHAGGKRI